MYKELHLATKEDVFALMVQTFLGDEAEIPPISDLGLQGVAEGEEILAVVGPEISLWALAEVYRSRAKCPIPLDSEQITNAEWLVVSASLLEIKKTLESLGNVFWAVVCQRNQLPIIGTYALRVDMAGRAVVVKLPD